MMIMLNGVGNLWRPISMGSKEEREGPSLPEAVVKNTKCKLTKRERQSFEGGTITIFSQKSFNILPLTRTLSLAASQNLILADL